MKGKGGEGEGAPLTTFFFNGNMRESMKMKIQRAGRLVGMRLDSAGTRRYGLLRGAVGAWSLGCWTAASGAALAGLDALRMDGAGEAFVGELSLREARAIGETTLSTSRVRLRRC